MASPDFGRKIGNFRERNEAIDEFNANYVGTLTAHGRALVSAGLFSEAQLKQLGAVVPRIARAPESNPWPVSNSWTVNARVDQPFVIERGWQARISPYVLVNNVFNHAPPNPYSSLTGLFGALNYDYANAPAGRQASDLRAQLGRSLRTRLLQIGWSVIDTSLGTGDTISSCAAIPATRQLQ